MPCAAPLPLPPDLIACHEVLTCCRPGRISLPPRRPRCVRCSAFRRNPPDSADHAGPQVFMAIPLPHRQRVAAGRPRMQRPARRVTLLAALLARRHAAGGGAGRRHHAAVPAPRTGDDPRRVGAALRLGRVSPAFARCSAGARAAMWGMVRIFPAPHAGVAGQTVAPWRRVILGPAAGRWRR